MQDSTLSTFRALAMAAGLQNGKPITTTNGKLIRQEAIHSHHRMKLRLVQRALQAGVAEGLAFINPRIGDNKRQSSYNRPFIIFAPRKGIEFLVGLDDKEKNGEPLEPQIHLVPDSDAKRPLDGRFKLPTERRLPIEQDPSSMTWDRKDKAIMDCLMAMCQKARKPYCYPTRKTIVKNCLKYSKVKMSLRCLDYHLDRLEAGGSLRRSCRHERQPDDTWTFHSNLIELCQRAWRWIVKELSKLSKLAVAFALQKIAITSLSIKGIIQGGGPPNAASPPRFREKEAVNLPVSLLKPGPAGWHKFNGQVSTSGR